MPIFGHFMMECLNRLWFVVQNPELKSKILFIITGRGNHCSYFDDFFRLMGIASERIIYVDKPIQCRSVTVPDQAQYWDSYNKEWQLPYLAMKIIVDTNEVGSGGTLHENPLQREVL